MQLRELYDRGYFEGTPVGVTASPIVGVERFPRKFGVEKKMVVLPPTDIISQLDDKDWEVIGWVNQIEVKEYEGGPGDLAIVTSGMHGEETLEKLAANELEDTLQKYTTDFKSGSLVIIPHLNLPGFINKTRYVFADESNTNLNNVFNSYKTGEWEEFRSLNSKTAKYGWLVMKYLTSKHEEHKKKFGSNTKARLFDLHRDDRYTIPYLRIDRMYEDRDLLELMFNAFRTVEIPPILEYSDWAEEGYGYHQSLSAVATKLGIVACTIEEGRTAVPDYSAPPYLAYVLTKYMIGEGMIDLSEEWNVDTLVFEKYTQIHHQLQQAQTFWKHIIDTGEIYRLDDLVPLFNTPEDTPLSIRELLAMALNKKHWDGVISVSFRGGLVGRGDWKENKPIGKIVFGKVGTDVLGRFTSPIDANILLPELPKNWQNISVPESTRKNDLCVYLGFVYEEDKIKARIFDGFPKPPYLNSSQIRELLDRRLEVDFSPLYITFALPDAKWKGEVENGEIRFSSKSN